MEEIAAEPISILLEAVGADDSFDAITTFKHMNYDRKDTGTVRSLY